MGTPRSTTPPPVQVTPPPGSRLEQLMVMLPDAEAALEEAKQHAGEIKAGIEAEAAALAAAANGGILPYGIRIAGVLGFPARRMSWHGKDRKFDAARFDADHPGMRDPYWVPKKPYWKMDKEGG